MSTPALSPTIAGSILRQLLASRERDMAFARQLANIERILYTMADQIQMLTAAVGAAVDEMQAAIDELAAHPVAIDDPAVTALITRLQNSTSALSTAVTQHGQPIPPTPPTDTVTGGGATGATGA